MTRETIAALLAEGSFFESFVRTAYLPALILHLGGGIVGLLSGAAALFFRKGERAHILAGRVFLAAMLALGLSAPFIAISHVSFIMGPLAVYFVATGWASARRGEGRAGVIEISALVVVLGLAAAYFAFGAQAAGSPRGRLEGYTAAFHYAFGSIALFAAALDLNAILRLVHVWAPRVSRHLWRMCFAMALGAMAFFLGQADRFPEFISASGLNIVLAVTPFIVMLVWLVRVRFMKSATAPAIVALPARFVGGVFVLAVAVSLFGLMLPHA